MITAKSLTPKYTCTIFARGFGKPRCVHVTVGGRELSTIIIDTKANHQPMMHIKFYNHITSTELFGAISLYMRYSVLVYRVVCAQHTNTMSMPLKITIYCPQI